MKKLVRKLTLNRETVRQLSQGEVSWIAAGADRTNEPFCESDALTCHGQCGNTT